MDIEIQKFVSSNDMTISGLVISKIGDIVDIRIKYNARGKHLGGVVINHYSLSDKKFILYNIETKFYRYLSNFEMTWFFFNNQDKIKKMIETKYNKGDLK